MDVQPIVADSSYLVYITNEELSERGLTAESTGPIPALELISPALPQLSGPVLDVFPGRAGLLIFVRSASVRRDSRRLRAGARLLR